LNSRGESWFLLGSVIFEKTDEPRGDGARVVTPGKARVAGMPPLGFGDPDFPYFPSGGVGRVHLRKETMNDELTAQRDDEIFDVVDQDDRVIGQAKRVDVHREKLWHRAIHALVFNRAGQVFLQKRSMAKDMAPGCWDSSCSGHLDAGEAYDVAVMRELGEEIGVHLAGPPARWFYEKARAETGWEFVWVYRLAHDGPFELHPAEIETGGWFLPAEVSAAIALRPEIYAPAFRCLWVRSQTYAWVD
jgi:isopentenyl-diphosphate delta-isomerase